MPLARLNHTRLEVEYAVPTPSLELGDHEGGIPGFPNATLAAEDSVAMSVLLIKTQPQHHRRWVSSALLPSRRAIGGSKHLAVAFQLPIYQITKSN
jgi:hypothetical protein